MPCPFKDPDFLGINLKFLMRVFQIIAWNKWRGKLSSFQFAICFIEHSLHLFKVEYQFIIQKLSLLTIKIMLEWFGEGFCLFIQLKRCVVSINLDIDLILTVRRQYNRDKMKGKECIFPSVAAAAAKLD